jgi:hypothetical protein
MQPNRAAELRGAHAQAQDFLGCLRRRLAPRQVQIDVPGGNLNRRI